MAQILVVDNYDSFVYTIVGYLHQLGARCSVVRNDELDGPALKAAVGKSQGVLISPGPGRPDQAGCSGATIAECAATATPMLGVCLGHQVLGMVFGATVDRAPELLHGKTSLVHHDDSGVLEGLPEPFRATRYHSLAIVRDTVPETLQVNGWTESGVVMALRHRHLPLHGVQFHPESVLTQRGHRLLATWLEMCGARGAVEASEHLGPLVGAGPGR